MEPTEHQHRHVLHSVFFFCNAYPDRMGWACTPREIILHRHSSRRSPASLRFASPYVLHRRSATADARGKILLTRGAGIWTERNAGWVKVEGGCMLTSDGVYAAHRETLPNASSLMTRSELRSRSREDTLRLRDYRGGICIPGKDVRGVHPLTPHARLATKHKAGVGVVGERSDLGVEVDLWGGARNTDIASVRLPFCETDSPSGGVTRNKAYANNGTWLIKRSTPYLPIQVVGEIVEVPRRGNYSPEPCERFSK